MSNKLCRPPPKKKEVVFINQCCFIRPLIIDGKFEIGICFFFA